MTSNVPESRPGWLSAFILAALAVVTAAAVWRGPQPLPAPAVENPGASLVVRDRCAECHSEIVTTYQNAPHARTLHRVTEPAIISKFAGRSFTRSSTGVEYRYRESAGELWLSTAAYGRELPIRWLVGSGSHAQTPLITIPDADGRTGAIEHVVSWYPSGKLGTTFGADGSEDKLGLGAIGRHWGPAETSGCFGCHSADVPVHGGKLDEAKIIPNLDCARCHWNTAGHVKEMDAGGTTSIERLGSLAPLEAVERCGECHRRAEDFQGAITHDNKSIVRFAPVGLIQSPCFLKQADVKLADGKVGRMDCATCHDPHVGSVRPEMISISCGKCHAGTAETARHCSSSMTDANCLPCHMPKVPMNEELSFTDHWIRVRGK
jgi:hypothetical protein